MSHEDLSDATLILFGHGTTENTESSAPVYQHAAALRQRNALGQVREAFWKQEPQLHHVLKDATSRRIFLAPLFISDGYFSAQIIPVALGFQRKDGVPQRLQRQGQQTLFYCHPVGTHPSMTRVLLARAQDVVQRFPFPRAPAPKDITLFIAGHGTEQNERSRGVIDRQAELIRAMNIYADVQAIFLEEEPRIQACFGMAHTRNIVIAPFFISDGLHVQQDIPILLGEPERIVSARLAQGQPTWRNPSEKRDKLVWYSASVGTEPSIADVILERVREAAQWQAME